MQGRSPLTTTTKEMKTETRKPTYLEPAYWSKDDQSKIGDMADLLADLPDSILSVMETAFLTFEVSFPWEAEQDEPDLLENTRKMIVATGVARCQ